MKQKKNITLKQAGDKQILIIREGRFIVTKNVIGIYEFEGLGDGHPLIIDLPTKLVGKDVYLILCSYATRTLLHAYRPDVTVRQIGLSAAIALNNRRYL